MKVKFFGLAALGFMLTTLLLAAMPARAQDVDQRIQTLEQELLRLKSEQAQVKAEQMEMKKQAVEAAAALPNFSYRPGSGMLIEAADKSWSFRTTIEAHFRLLFEQGLEAAGRETGGIMGRRFRPWFYYCVNDCFYEIQVGLDLDGFGTGNAKNSTNSATSSILQRGELWVHFEKLNPWLPAFYTGMDGEAAISSYRQGSSSTGAQLEYDMLTRNTGFNTGRWGNGFGLNWQDKDLSGILIPGRIPLLNIVYATIGEGDDGLQSFRSPRSVSTYLNVEPFSQIKNKWIQGIGLEFGQWWCPNTNSTSVGLTTPATPSVGCTQIQVRDNGDGGRQVMVQTPAYGHGSTHLFVPGMAWTVGPYRLRLMTAFQRESTDSPRCTAGVGGCPANGHLWGSQGHKSGNVFLIGHDLYAWSPKGFLTGSAETPGSILFGTHFERTNVDCGARLGCVGGQFGRQFTRLSEWDLWYVLMPRMSVGAAWMWYHASNLRTGVNQAGSNLGIFSQRCSPNTAGTGMGPCSGRSGEWADFSVTWRYQF